MDRLDAIRVSGKQGTYCYDGRPYIRHGPVTQIMPQGEYEKRILTKLHLDVGTTDRRAVC